MTRIVFVLASLLAGCAAGDFGPDTAQTTPQAEETVPVGNFLGGDDVTEGRIFDLLLAHGIKVIAYGSLGYTVAVPVSRADEARRLLADAIAHDGLQAGVYTAEDLERAR
jgi:hypothetical protein